MKKWSGSKQIFMYSIFQLAACLDLPTATRNVALTNSPLFCGKAYRVLSSAENFALVLLYSELCPIYMFFFTLSESIVSLWLSLSRTIRCHRFSHAAPVFTAPSTKQTHLCPVYDCDVSVFCLFSANKSITSFPVSGSPQGWVYS